MISENLKKQVVSFWKLSTTDLEIIASKFTYNEFRQKEYILVEGKISTHLHFIESGLVRVFHLREAKETTTYLSSDNGFVSSYSSFINQTKSVENIQCLEKTETLSISFKGCRSCMIVLLNGKKLEGF
ncbi:MAG: cyclic nucleotide-binding domain-containing protein [Bacteroidota bacterium]